MKKLNIFLVISLFAIWGFVAFKFLDTPDAILNDSNFTSLLDTTNQNIKYNLLLDYHDPFTKGNIVTRPNLPSKKSSTNLTLKTAPPIKVNQKDKLADIKPYKYLGLILSKKDSTCIGLIQKNGSPLMISKGDTLAEFVVKEIKEDTLILLTADEKIFFLKKY